MKGKLIVIEGIDGCGKTTQINEISKWLPNSGLMSKNSELITTREPGGSLLGKKLRRLILDNDENYRPSYLAELLLYSADRAEHVSKIISPALKNKNWVLSDRFSGSTLAYQGYGRNINLDIIKDIESIVCQGIAFLEKVNKGFKVIAKEKNWKIISASQNIKNISDQIKEVLLENFSEIND